MSSILHWALSKVSGEQIHWSTCCTFLNLKHGTHVSDWVLQEAFEALFSSSSGTLSNRRRSRGRGGQTIEIQSASIPLEWKSSCWPPPPQDRVFLFKVPIEDSSMERGELCFSLCIKNGRLKIGDSTKNRHVHNRTERFWFSAWFC